MLAFAHLSDSIIAYISFLVCPILSLNMKVERTESRIEDVLTTLMPQKVLEESLALKFWLFLRDIFFPQNLPRSICEAVTKCSYICWF